MVIAAGARVKQPGEIMRGDDVELIASQRPARRAAALRAPAAATRCAATASLFTRDEAVEAAWRVVDPVLDAPATGRDLRARQLGPRSRAATSSPAARAGTTRVRKRERHADAGRRARRPSSCSTSTTRCSTTTASAPTSTRTWSATFGAAQRDATGRLYEALRDELGYADYLGALQRFRAELDDDPRRCCRCRRSCSTIPFADGSIRSALEVVAHLRTLRAAGRCCPTATSCSSRARSSAPGCGTRCEGRVLVYMHKERMLDAMQRRYPGAALRDGRRQAAAAGGDEARAGRAR